jgi:hypothetical protein
MAVRPRPADKPFQIARLPSNQVDWPAARRRNRTPLELANSS